MAGVVAAVGPDTPEFAVGDEVVAYAHKEVAAGNTVLIHAAAGGVEGSPCR